MTCPYSNTRSNVHARRGERDLARSHYESALDALGEPQGEDAGGLARLYADWSLLSHGQDERDEAAGFARRALDLAEGTGDTRSLAQAHNMLGILAGRSGDQEAALRHLEESLDLAEALGDSDVKVAALNNLALAREHGGESGEALRLAEGPGVVRGLGGQAQGGRASQQPGRPVSRGGPRTRVHDTPQAGRRALRRLGREEMMLQPEIWKLVEW